MNLFANDDPAAWKRALDGYPSVIDAMAVPRLVELDAWYERELPSKLASRTPPYATLDELAQATEWKMKRGEWRARNLMLVKNNPAETVRKTTEDGFALIPDPRKPVAKIAELDGVGPATASALLAALRPDVYPFFDEIVAEQIPELGKVAFTIPYYLRYATRLRERAASLGAPFTPHSVAQALFSAAGGKTKK
jgi:hypothetical protein